MNKEVDTSSEAVQKSVTSDFYNGLLLVKTNYWLAG